MAIESYAIARFARISPRKARVVINLVRGRKVAQALDLLAYTRKAAAPIVRKLIESALANAKQADSSVDVDTLYVTTGAVDKGPNSNLRRYRPRAMGRATPIQKGMSHIQLTLTDIAPEPKPRKTRGRTKPATDTGTGTASESAASTDESTASE